jgi:hypothetical protein
MSAPQANAVEAPLTKREFVLGLAVFWFLAGLVMLALGAIALNFLEPSQGSVTGVVLGIMMIFFALMLLAYGLMLPKQLKT